MRRRVPSRLSITGKIRYDVFSSALLNCCLRVIGMANKACRTTILMMERMKTNKTLRLIGLAGLAILLSVVPMLAHHAFSAFDMSKTTTVSGAVKEFQWINPHSWIQLMVTDASGPAVEWSVEMGSPSSLVRQGWKPKTLKPGDQITINMHPLRDGRPGGSLVSAMLPDGTRIGGSPTGESQPPK